MIKEEKLSATLSSIKYSFDQKKIIKEEIIPQKEPEEKLTEIQTEESYTTEYWVINKLKIPYIPFIRRTKNVCTRSNSFSVPGDI